MIQSDTGSYLTALPCSVCLRHSPAPFPHSTTHTKTHAWSPPPPLLPLLVRGEREAESSEERTLVELYKVRVNTDRWRFHAGFVFSLPFSITYPAILPEAVCSRQSRWWHHGTLSQSKAWVHMAKKDTFTPLPDILSTKLLSLPKTACISHFNSCSAAGHPAMQCKTGFI